MEPLARFVVAFATLWTALGLVAVLALTRRRPVLAKNPPGISVLKPLCGADVDLERTLESFFTQDHPEFELVFGVVDRRDPALRVVERLRARHPDVACRVVIHPGSTGLNPKVANLRGMLPEVRHDLVLISDSNVLAPAHYLREIAGLYDAERPGLITNVFAGTGEDSLGAALENVQLNGFVAAGLALPTWFGDPLVVGKSMAFSKQRFEELGGFARVADVLAEDFVMGKTFEHAGEPVLVAPTVLANITRDVSLGTMFARQLRWAMLRYRLRSLVSALEPLTSPVALLPAAWLLVGPWSLLWAALLLLVRDVGGWIALRGTSRWYVPVLLAPLRELALLLVWVVAPLKQHVCWRGKRFRLGAGTLLYPVRARQRASHVLGWFDPLRARRSSGAELPPR